jgi:hypothetical protein
MRPPKADIDERPGEEEAEAEERQTDPESRAKRSASRLVAPMKNAAASAAQDDQDRVGRCVCVESQSTARLTTPFVSRRGRLPAASASAELLSPGRSIRPRLERQSGGDRVAPALIARYRELVAGVWCSQRITRFLPWTAALLVLIGGTASVALARSATTDRTPPDFAGLTSATTCVAGPVGGQSTTYELRWDSATDDVTPSSKIVYDVYQAATPGGEDYSSPT